MNGVLVAAVTALAVVSHVGPARAFVSTSAAALRSSPACAGREGAAPSAIAASKVCSRTYWRGRVSRRARRTRLGAEGDASPSPLKGPQLGPNLTPAEFPVLPPPEFPMQLETVAELEEKERVWAKEWEDDGRRGCVLVRRKEIPSPDKDPVTVCQLVFEALQVNDDPMLDYGAAVAIRFASSRFAIRNMTPLEFGTFLRRNPEYYMILENRDINPAEMAKISADGNHVLQKVELRGCAPENLTRIVDVWLSKEDGCWRIDSISFVPLPEESQPRVDTSRRLR